MKRYDVLTLFPEMIRAACDVSILGRGQKAGHFQLNCHQIRDFTLNKQRQVDDYPFGGGTGLILTPEPLHRAWESVKTPHSRTVYLSPTGKPFNQAEARRLLEYEHLILVCGRYEGIDERFVEECVDECVSLGDFVLTGGEIAAMAVVDAVARLIPGVLADEESFQGESHWNGLLEHPQYTRPAEWRGRNVPEVLLSGNHAAIEIWRREQSLQRTQELRLDLYKKWETKHHDTL